MSKFSSCPSEKSTVHITTEDVDLLWDDSSSSSSCSSASSNEDTKLTTSVISRKVAGNTQQKRKRNEISKQETYTQEVEVVDLTSSDARTEDEEQFHEHKSVVASKNWGENSYYSFGWVWMRNKSRLEEVNRSEQSFDLAKMRKEWNVLVKKRESNINIKSGKPGKPNLKDAADVIIQNKCLCGKWMLNVSEEEVDQVWSDLRHLLCNTNLLGPCDTIKISPTATPRCNGVKATHLICVYIPDFTDVASVDTCLAGIRSIYNSERRLYFKADGMTYLGIYSGNPWRLKVSFYSHDSESCLNWEEEGIKSSKLY